MTGQVTITNAIPGTAGYDHGAQSTYTSSQSADANYTVLVEDGGRDDKDRVGEIKISSKAINGVTTR
jgi:hypothetical protein